MTCQDARELFSAHVDEALTADERAGLDAHLATCAECRRELDRFQRTVALVQGIPAPRAPAGFADRVLETARPTPWPARIARGLFVPWTRKLPLEAAAVVMIAGLAVLVFERTPAMRQAARLDAPAPDRAPAARTEAPGAAADTAQRTATIDGERERSLVSPPPRVPPSESPAVADTRDVHGLGFERRASEPRLADRGGAGGRSAAERDAGDVEARLARDVAARSRASQDATANGQAAREPIHGESRYDVLKPAMPPSPSVSAQPESSAARALDVEPREAETRTAPSLEARPREPVRDGPRILLAPAPAAPPAASAPARPRLSATAAREEAATPVSGHLAALDRSTAERDVSALASRLGARLASRRAESGATVMELLVPRDRYAELSQELARLGTWRADREPADGGSVVRVIIQLAP